MRMRATPGPVRVAAGVVGVVGKTVTAEGATGLAVRGMGNEAMGGGVRGGVA